MVLIKSKPEQRMSETVFPQTFNSLIQAFFDDSVQTTGKNGFMPLSDIVEHSNAYEIKMSLPGMKKEDIKITLDGDQLTISGERSNKLSEESSRFVKREIAYGHFSRTFKLGKVDSSDIAARFEDGLLIVHIPRKSEDKQMLIPVQ